jgi:hypothetical protein
MPREEKEEQEVASYQVDSYKSLINILEAELEKLRKDDPERPEEEIGTQATDKNGLDSTAANTNSEE